MYGNSLNELDVTDSVRVSNPEAVKHEVLAIFSRTHQQTSNSALIRAFDLFAQLFHGLHKGYLACDTLYHDIQHSLDITLSTARLISGYQKSHRQQLTADHMLLGIVTALFHDAGYIRKSHEQHYSNGAEFTSIHVSRGAEFILEQLPAIGLGHLAERAAQIVHYTGYEKSAEELNNLIDSPEDKIVGEFVATADLITQMADRCYIEKCRDRLYPELLLAAASPFGNTGATVPSYDSSYDLLQQTPRFYHQVAKPRLERQLHNAYQYAADYFNGPNFYMARVEENIRYLERLLKHKALEKLRRQLPPNNGQSLFPFERIKEIELSRGAYDDQLHYSDLANSR